MKAEQLQLVLQSLNAIQPLSDKISASFYQRLFEIEPAIQGLFKGDMKRQGSMFISTLSLAANGLSRIEDIKPAVQTLGERHFGYGVKPEYFQPFREAFIWALEHHLGDQFNAEVKSAWTEAFDMLSEAMIAKLDTEG
jgi:hemoglobin-like flavoprotein